MKSDGITLVGLLLGIAVGAILLGGLMIFATRGFGIPREQTEQVRIVDDARIQIERMSDAIRDARSLDNNGDGLASLPEEEWLQLGRDLEIQFYANYDNDPELELVHYFLEGTDLKLGVRDPYNGPPEQVTVVARSVRNQEQNVPLFLYYPAEGDAPFRTPLVSVDGVKRVGIDLLVDVDVRQEPGVANVSTIVTPRVSRVLPSEFDPTPSPSPFISPTPTPTPNPTTPPLTGP